jgi:twitching motility protein PilT
MVSIEELLQAMVERNASDLHLTQGSRPKLRVDGDLQDTEYEVLDAEATQKIVYSILDSTQIARFEKELELDMSFGVEGLGRFRTNVFLQRGAVGSVLRIIPYEIWSVDQIGLPRNVVEALCVLPRGLVLVTGATGSGKSTTLAAMIDYININRRDHIITVEDPIEFVHQNKNCLVNQREIGTDSHSFPEALKHVLRQDPDVVLVGEMRDVETMEAALTISETGHLTFATLHTSDAVQTVNRVVDAFPAYQQQQVRVQLSFTLQAVFCQQLLPKIQGKGRALAAEIMIANPAIRSLIREDKAHQMYSIIQTAQKEGMKTMNQSLFELYRANLITFDDASARSSDPEELKRLSAKG